ncbi:APLF, partial [Cervus elaphus hippelaphus]
NNVTRESEKERVCKEKTQVNITQQGKKRLISSGSSESTSAEQDTGKKCKNDDQEESIISSKLGDFTSGYNGQHLSSRNSQMLDEDDILNETPKSSSVDLPVKTPSAPQLGRSIETAETQTTVNNVSFIGESRDLSQQQPNPSQRKRILPAWMLTENSCDQNLSVISEVRSISDEDDSVGQPNEYNLNDSFIDDEEEGYEPTDEDSDWEPEKEDLEKEDMEGLLKEARKFMKRKKNKSRIPQDTFGSKALFCVLLSSYWSQNSDVPPRGWRTPHRYPTWFLQ